MIDRQQLLSDLQAVLKTLEQDLLDRSEAAEPAEVATIGQRLRAEYDRAKEANRTALSWVDWRAGEITQVAAAWVLSCVFARFLEDNDLVEPPRLSGSGERLKRAREEQSAFFSTRPTETDREYLLDVFDGLAQLPGAGELFGDHNPLRDEPNWLSGDAAGVLLRFFRKIEANTGELEHDFTDPEWGTRFLGDLYQDLSEAARKRYALLQTPDFVESFILDRTLEPALDEFGLQPSCAEDKRFKMIDPACGSGHFLLGAFERILDRWNRKEPATEIKDLVQRSLDSVHGVDVNPYAVAIARFRLLLAAMKASGVQRLVDAPNYQTNLACGDSLYHGYSEQKALVADMTDESHYFHVENAAELRRLLADGTYHCVVANPPYIVPKDAAANKLYRERYSACYRQYSLAVPFCQRIFRLAVLGENSMQAAGYTGQITANSFMKREFGKRLIEDFFPRVDLTHVIDTSGAYIPGHGTPTVILFGRRQRPVADTVRAVMGIRGEPSTPDDPGLGLVWTAITHQIDEPGSESDFISVGDTERDRFATHPWSIGGGGAAELKEQLDDAGDQSLGSLAAGIGFAVITGEDNCLLLPPDVPRRHGVTHTLPMVDGDVVRDWVIDDELITIWPNDDVGTRLSEAEIRETLHFLWQYRRSLQNRKAFGVPIEQRGIPWWALREVYTDKLRTPLSIVFAFVATHNHFVLDRGGKVFKQSAPVIKLPEGATEEDHLALLGLLNSSVACFWMKQVFHSKGSQGVNEGLKTEAWEHFREFTGTGLKSFPLPMESSVSRSGLLDRLAQEASEASPGEALCAAAPLHDTMQSARRSNDQLLGEMIAHQEELDWECYSLYGLLDDNLTIDEPPPLELGQRAFEIVMARKMATGELETTWFERHGSTPITVLPGHWPDDYQRLVERRIELIESDKNIGLIERPEYKRRWSTEPWEEQVEKACKNWLLDRLESYFDIDDRMAGEAESSGVGEHCRFHVEVTSVGKLADAARADERFQEVGEVYTGDEAFDVARLVEELVRGESVPLLPVLRYKPPGLRKRAAWEETWALQRREDAGEEVGDIPVPPKYNSSDFVSTGGARYWALRGKLDVPKERWVSFPHCDAADGTPAIAWAGLDHLQLAQAVSSFYVDIKERQGGNEDPRLIPLLGCLLELIPWLKQWHNEVDPEYNLRMGDYYEGFVSDEAMRLPRPTESADGEEGEAQPATIGWTLDEIKSWQPPQRRRGRRRRASS
ncbi:MAG: BREX-2 system adenine-specific DNA-methyltransferase PglX [Planctomycetota bacterium]